VLPEESLYARQVSEIAIHTCEEARQRAHARVETPEFAVALLGFPWPKTLPSKILAFRLLSNASSRDGCTSLEDPRSLLKISFAQRVDHSKKPQAFAVLASARPPSAVTETGSFASSCVLSSQFWNTDQVEGRAAEHEQAVTFASPRSFTFFRDPICFNHPNGFSTNQRLLKLIA